jgi:hypothetical protein
VITQERTALQARNALEARQFLDGDSEEKSVGNFDSDELLSLFPRFREAKPKTGADLSIELTITVHLIPVVSSAFFVSETVLLSLPANADTGLSRAPPIQI